MPKVSAPSAISRRFLAGEPQVRTRSSTCEITHTEYFSDLAGLNSGQLPVVPDQETYIAQEISPTNVALFPWLSTVARRYETYTFKKLKFRYEPLAPTNIQGSVILAVDYDPSDSFPSTKSDLLSFDESVRSPPWSDSVHVSKSGNLSRRGELYTDFSTTNNSDGSIPQKRQQYVGRFYAAGLNAPIALTFGELYVDYTICLHTPQTNSIVPMLSSYNTTTSSWTIVPADVDDNGNLDSTAQKFFSYIPFAVPQNNRIRIGPAIDRVILILKQEGTAILSGPGITYVRGYTLNSTLMQLVNPTGTQAMSIFDLSLKAAGAEWDFVTGVATTITALRFFIIPVTTGSLGPTYWGAQFM